MIRFTLVQASTKIKKIGKIKKRLRSIQLTKIQKQIYSFLIEVDIYC
jgi:hypothetical protein